MCCKSLGDYLWFIWINADLITPQPTVRRILIHKEIENEIYNKSRITKRMQVSKRGVPQVSAKC